MIVTILLIHIFSCWCMTGIIWLVQILVYPNFNNVGPNEFKKFHQFHTNRITWVVAPFMGGEILSAVTLVILIPNGLFFFNLISVFATWALTAFLNVPAHNVLSFEKKNTLAKLILKNWPRTIVWTVRAIFCFYLLSANFNGGGI